MSEQDMTRKASYEMGDTIPLSGGDSFTIQGCDNRFLNGSW